MRGLSSEKYKGVSVVWTLWLEVCPLEYVYTFMYMRMYMCV